MRRAHVVTIQRTSRNLKSVDTIVNAVNPVLLSVLRGYYEHASLELSEPYPRFHQHRLRLPSDKFLKIRDTIRTPEDLKKWCVQLTPLDVFHTVNPFLSPSNVSCTEFNGKKAGWNISDNLLLGDGALIFDVDYHERGFDEAKRDALGIHDYLKERGYSINQTNHTGRGFQILVTEHDLHLPQIHPKPRFNLYREKRKPIVEDLKQRGIQIDAEISLDAKRVVRTVGSLNATSGHECKVVNNLEKFEECVEPNCIIPGAYLPISQLKQGNLCFGRSGVVRVGHVFSRNYDGPLIEILGKGLFPFRVTPNHPILVSTMLCRHGPWKTHLCTKHLGSYYTYKTKTSITSFTKPHWSRAEALTDKRENDSSRHGQYDGHYLVLPRLKGTCRKRRLNLMPFIKLSGRSKAGIKNHEYVLSLPLTPDVAWLLGMYVAEGSSSVGHIQFSICVRELNLRRRIHRIGKVLGYSVYDSKPARNGIMCIIPSHLLARALQAWCGKWAENKHVPDFILLHRSQKIIRAFLSGYVDGDGHIENQRGYKVLRVSCASRILVSQLQLLYARLGIWAGAYVEPRYNYKREHYRLHSRLRKKGNQSGIVARVFDDAIFVPINHIKKVGYRGSVNNIKTDDGTYLVSNVVVHNCDAERLSLESYHPVTRFGADDRFLPNEKEACDPLWVKGGGTVSVRTKLDQTNPANSTPNPVIYLGSPVMETLDRQVVMLRFKSDVNIPELTKTLSRFAAQEQLAPFLIFKSAKDPEGLWCISPTAIQTAGMKRLLRRYPKDSATYAKFRRRIVPLSIEYVGQSSGVSNSEIPVSKAHLKYFQHYGLLKNYVPRVKCGSPNLLATPIGEMK
jgi:hypothetical protein